MSTQTATLPLYESTKTEKPHIPIIDTVVTDQQLSNHVVRQQQPINLNKVYKLLTDQHSWTLYDRHVSALHKITHQYKNGFAVKDIVVVYKILNVCADRVEVNPHYEGPLIDIIKLCGLSYLKEKSSDHITFGQIVVESISHLGYLMRIPSTRVRQEICRTLVTFFCDDSHFAVIDNFQPTSLDQRQKAISESDIAETMVKSLSLLDGDEELMKDVLFVLEKFSKHTAACCNQMLSANAAYMICSQLTRFDPAGKTLFVSVNILWNLLENGDSKLAATQLANIVCINQLRDSFLYQLTQGFSHYHRQLRNDLLTLSNLVATHCPQAPFIESGFTKQLCSFATFQEVKSHSVLVRHLKLEVNQEDFEMKKILYTLLTQLSNDDTVVPILSEGGLVHALFTYVRANHNAVTRRDWSPAQFEEIQLLAMSCLVVLCPMMLQDYTMYQGSTRLLLLLEWCVSQDEYGGHGNSFHGTGGRGNKRAQMHYCLRLLRSVVSMGDALVIQDLVDQGAISQLTVILSNAVCSSDADDAIDIEMQSDMLTILSFLCDDEPHNKELMGETGVDVIVSYINMDPVSIQGGLGHHKLLITAIDAVWSCIVGCTMMEDRFLEKEGVCLLLDLLTHVPKAMMNLALGCLLDLCDNPKTSSHLLVWRGSGEMNLVNMMCDLWREVEHEVGVKRNGIGAIIDLEAPLKSEAQKSAGVVSLPAHLSSAAIVDVSENMRSKIYALLAKIGFSQWRGLPVQDYITLSIIEKYMDLKMAEVWLEIRDELDVENVRPISPDAQAIEEITRDVSDRNGLLRDTQIELSEAQRVKDLMDEEEAYKLIKANNKQKENTIEMLEDFINRTSNYGYLKEAKNKQKLAIERSRVVVSGKKSSVQHNTNVDNNNVTTFSGVKVHVDSTPVTITGGHLAQYNPDTGTRIPPFT